MNSLTTNPQYSSVPRIPIKLIYGDQIRRFTTDLTSFSKLESDIRVIFNWEIDSKFDVKYLDDEKDLILISSDEELKAATQLFKDPQTLRLILDKKDSSSEKILKGNETNFLSQPPKNETTTTSTTTTTTNLPPSPSVVEFKSFHPYQHPHNNFDWRQKKFEKKEWKRHRKIEKELEHDFVKDIKNEHKEFKRSQNFHYHHHHHRDGRGLHIDQQQQPLEGGCGKHQRNFIARLVKHLTCDDGMEYAPNIEFEKIWRIRNDGSQVWPKGTKFLRVSMKFGNELNAPEFIELNEEVQPGGIIDIKVSMKTPNKEGWYENYWKMQLQTNGQKFGQRFRCQLKVATITSDESSNEEKKKTTIHVSNENNNNCYNNDNDNNKKEKNCYRYHFDELEKKWNVQLMLLETLGFKKRRRIIKLLEKFQGDVNKVLNVIISHKQRESGVIIDNNNNNNNNNEAMMTVTKTVNNQN